MASMQARSVPPPPAAPAQPLTQRAVDWLSENRRALLIAAGVIVVAGGGYYYYSSSNEPPPSSKKVRKGPKRRSKAGKANGTTSETDKQSASDGDLERGEAKPPATVEDDQDDLMKMSSEAISALSAAKRKEHAGELKVRGNRAYQARKHKAAYDLYTKALEFDEQAVFYSNRAACQNGLDNLQGVIDDCTSALRLDPAYIKALNRRAVACENVGGEEKLYQALCDYTAAAILEQFGTDSTAQAVERIMKQLATEKAKVMLENREPRIPSYTFIKAYLEAFRPRSPPTIPESASQGDSTLKLAFEALEARDYTHAFSLFNESVEQGLSTNELHARALNMRGTFRFIMGSAAEALEDLDYSTNLNHDDVQTWVKKASVHMELGDSTAAFNDFDTAVKVDPDNADIYYHRGQVYFIQQQFSKAIEEYKKSTALDNTFIFSQIQHAVALYKDGSKDRAVNRFKKCLNMFGNESGEVHNYYGELLLDQQNFDDAAASFDKAIQLEKKKPGPLNVLPMVNKALCVFQARQAFDEAEELCREALEHDEACDVAVATYAQLLLQRNKIREAVDMFARGAALARTEPELVNALNFELATRAQIAFIDNYPEQAARLGLTQQGGPPVPR